MFVWADALLEDHPAVPDWLAHRFPLVILDEMQDTFERQASFLNAVFPRTSDKIVVQRVGDPNQQIFDLPDLGSGAFISILVIPTFHTPWPHTGPGGPRSRLAARRPGLPGHGDSRSPIAPPAAGRRFATPPPRSSPRGRSCGCAAHRSRTGPAAGR